MSAATAEIVEGKVDSRRGKGGGGQSGLPNLLYGPHEDGRMLQPPAYSLKVLIHDQRGGGDEAMRNQDELRKMSGGDVRRVNELLAP
jgi:hypothetical protein